MASVTLPPLSKGAMSGSAHKPVPRIDIRLELTTCERTLVRLFTLIQEKIPAVYSPEAYHERQTKFTHAYELSRELDDLLTRVQHVASSYEKGSATQIRFQAVIEGFSKTHSMLMNAQNEFNQLKKLRELEEDQRLVRGQLEKLADQPNLPVKDLEVIRGNLLDHHNEIMSYSECYEDSKFPKDSFDELREKKRNLVSFFNRLIDRFLHSLNKAIKQTEADIEILLHKKDVSIGELKELKAKLDMLKRKVDANLQKFYLGTSGCRLAFDYMESIFFIVESRYKNLLSRMDSALLGSELICYAAAPTLSVIPEIEES